MFPNVNIDRKKMIKDIEKGLENIENHFFEFEVSLYALDPLGSGEYNGIKCKLIAKDKKEYREVNLHPLYAYFDPVNSMIETVKENKYRIWKDIIKKRKNK